MSKSTRDFWKTAEDWSRRKHLVLSYYLKPAAAKLRSRSPDKRVIMIDGFAGRGKYEDGTAGSPIYMGQLINDCLAWQNPVDLRVFNIEPDDKSFTDLERCTRSWTERGLMINLHKTFRESVPSLIEQAGSSPLFVFLDPFRPTDLLFEDFAPLLARTAPTEFFIVFHTPAALRMLRAVMPNARTPLDAKESSKRTLNTVFGGARWERFLAGEEISSENLVNCFIEEIASRAGRPSYIGSHRIEVRRGVGLKYDIVFFTRHSEGVKLLNDAFCTEASDVQSQERVQPSSQLTMELDDAPSQEVLKAKRLEPLCESLIQIGGQNPAREWTRSDLTFASILKRFGEYRVAEHNQAIKMLFDRTTPPRFIPIDGTRTKKGTWITNDGTRIRFESSPPS